MEILVKSDKIKDRAIVPARPTEEQIKAWLEDDLEIIRTRGESYGDSWFLGRADALGAWLNAKGIRIHQLTRMLQQGISQKQLGELKDSLQDIRNYAWLLQGYMDELEKVVKDDS